MPAPTSTADILEIIRKSQLVDSDRLDALAGGATSDPAAVIRQLQADGTLTAFQAEQLLKGRHKGFILGKYRLLDRIGMGGMGQVYLAEHVSMKRRVAIKVLPPDRCKNEFARERFQREAKAAAAVEHPNIVRIYDLELDGDVSYLVMEFIDGVTFHELVARRGPLEPGRAAHYLWQIANGLEAIHCFQLVHRDIKPANLLLDRMGVARIVDLGLVRSELDDDALTRGEGAKMLGTADYLAPEQAIECSKVDNRADLYSLGCTAFFMLTGQPPFPSDKISQKLIAHQTKAAPPIRSLNPAVPEGLAMIIHRLLAKKPEDRFQSATELLEALAPFVKPTIPDEADFPTPGSGVGTRSGISLNGWVSMNIVDRSGSQSSASGSAIRFHSDTNPKIPASQAQQQTKSNAAQETLPARPGIAPEVPATPAPSIKPKSTPKPAAKPPAIVVELKIPEPTPQLEESAKGHSTAIKADRLFRSRDVGESDSKVNLTSNRWIAVGLSILLMAVIGIGIVKFLK